MEILHVLTPEQRHVLAPHIERKMEADEKAVAAVRAANEAESALLRATATLVGGLPEVWNLAIPEGVIRGTPKGGG